MGIENDEVYVHIKEKIDGKLKKFKMPQLKMLDSEYVKYLIKIESSIIDIENERKNCISKYKAAKVNIKTINDRTGISRTTIYKYNDLLGEYIKNTQEELEEYDILRELDLKVQNINELKNQIKNLQFRALKEQLYLDKMEVLYNDYNIALKQISNLEIENAKLYNAIDELKAKKIGKVSEIFGN